MRFWLNVTDRLEVFESDGQPRCGWFAQMVGKVATVALIPGEAEPPDGLQLMIGNRTCAGSPVGETFRPGERLWFHASYAVELDCIP